MSFLVEEIAKRLKDLPDKCRLGDNSNAFTGRGFDCGIISQKRWLNKPPVDSPFKCLTNLNYLAKPL